MLGTIILTVFILLVVVVIFIEYKSAQRYKKEREEKRKTRKAPPSRVGPVRTVKKEEKKPEPKPEVVPEEVEEKPVVVEKVETKPEPEVVPEKIEEKVEEKLEAKELPPCDYPPFDHSRTVESLGLSEEDAKEFVGELITQIDTQLPLIEKELETADFHQLERLTHSIKGSATNLGTGGVSDLLTDFNTYLKEGTDMDVLKSYFECLQNYTQKLKDQYA